LERYFHDRDASREFLTGYVLSGLMLKSKFSLYCNLRGGGASKELF
jgi:hypothetical protein